MEKITVFTPTYNREKTLKTLYESLVNQTCKDFYWLIVDDGSTDNTNKIVETWIRENKIRIEYYKQENQGKSMAHNAGVRHATGELFVCVDSDDYLEKNAVECVINNWESSSKKYVGILAYKKTKNRIVTSIKDKNVQSGTLKNLYLHSGLKGDTMLVFKTSIIKKYEFPKFEGEKFVPEAYLYDLIDTNGNLLILRKALYVCEYLDDGYTSNMAKLLKNNSNGYMAFIVQRLKYDESFSEKFFDSVRCIAMRIARKDNCIIKNSVYPFVALLAYPLGYIFYLKRYKSI